MSYVIISDVAGVEPTMTNLRTNELGVNTADGKLWVNTGTRIKQVGGGEVPIRGIQKFSTNTPDDYTDDDDKRYLRRGVIELNTDNFDTDIWPATDVVPTNTFNMQDAGWGPLSNQPIDSGYTVSQGNGNLLTLYETVSGESSRKVLHSSDWGVTWAETNNAPNISSTTGSLTTTDYLAYTSAGVVALLPNAGNQTRVSFSADHYATAPTTIVVDNSSYGGSPNAIAASGDTVVLMVMGVSGFNARYGRSTDGGLTWTTIMPNPDIALNHHASWLRAKGTTWVKVNSNGNGVWVSTDDALTWTEHLNGLTDIVGRAHFFQNLWADDTYFYTKTGSNALFRSTDGINWVQQVVERDTNGAGYTNFSPNGISSKVVSGNGFFVECDRRDGSIYISKDGFNWHRHWYFSGGGQHHIEGGDAVAAGDGSVIIVHNSARPYIEKVQIASAAGELYIAPEETNAVASGNSVTEFVRIS